MVSILILNYNGKEYLKECLSSVLSQSYTDYEVILFDNCSSDGSIDYIRENFDDSRIKIVSSEKNYGFAGGNNEALKHAAGEMIVLLNNDTVVEKEWLSELVKCLNESHNAGMVQSLVLTDGIPTKYYKKNGTINLLGHNIMEVFDIGQNGIGEIFQVNGCSLIIQRELLDRIGGLFPYEYFAYAEDTYLSFKVKFLGYKIYHNAKSVVQHKGGATMRKYRNEFVTFYQERNRLLNFLVFFSDNFRMKYYPLMLYNLFLKLIYGLFSGRYSTKGVLKAYAWIMKNGKWIEVERTKLKTIQKISEEEVLEYLSGKAANGDNAFEKTLNSIMLFYLKLVNIKVIEQK